MTQMLVAEMLSRSTTPLREIVESAEPLEELDRRELVRACTYLALAVGQIEKDFLQDAEQGLEGRAALRHCNQVLSIFDQIRETIENCRRLVEADPEMLDGLQGAIQKVTQHREAITRIKHLLERPRPTVSLPDLEPCEPGKAAGFKDARKLLAELRARQS